MAYTVRMEFDDLVAEIRAVSSGSVTTLSYADIKFLHDCGICCWHLSGSLLFQSMIRDHGSEAEQQRLRDLHVGYAW
jgi:hypothetical protein